MPPLPHWVCLAPGVYDDTDGGLHLYVDDMLKAAGYADTVENRRVLIDQAERIFGAVVEEDKER